MNTKSQNINETIKIIKTRKQKLFNGVRRKKSPSRFKTIIHPFRKFIHFFPLVILSQQTKNPVKKQRDLSLAFKMTKDNVISNQQVKNPKNGHGILRCTQDDIFPVISKVAQKSLVVAISVLIIFTAVQASTTKITPPSGTPVATFYSLSEIYNFITSNTAATLGSPALDFSSVLEDTGRTLTEIYNALTGLISSDNVKLGTTYLGVAGRLTPIMTDGTATTTAVAADVLSGKTAHLSADWVLDTGTMTNNGAFALTASNTDQTVTAGYYSGGTLAGDADLAAGNIKSGVNIFGVAGDSNVVDTSSGDATAADILSGKTAWVDGLVVSGSMSTQTLSSANDTVSAGYYAATTLSVVDEDLTALNIKSGKTIFGVAGSAVVVDYSLQWLQAVDDATTTSEYTAEEGTWSAPTTTFSGRESIDYSDVVGNSTNIRDLASNTVKQDDRTGLWWTDAMSVNGLTTVTTTDNQLNTGRIDGVRPAVTEGNAMGFCNALNTYNSNAGFGGYTDWYLPTQKELMQAYIDGSANNLPNPGSYFWSSTQYYSNTANAWHVSLSTGTTNNTTKTSRYSISCVRRP